MKELILLVGPPGSGKSTLANKISGEDYHYKYVNQDSQGKLGHKDVFESALADGLSIIIDRLNFDKAQRDRYLKPAKALGYQTKIIVLHENYDTCMTRMHFRKDHETIRNNDSATSALQMFMKKYERVEDSEADLVERRWPDREKPTAIICDLDGTLCNIDQRLHYVRQEGKKDWKMFFQDLDKDTLNEWCSKILYAMAGQGYNTVLCSGRPDDHRFKTTQWLTEKNINYDNLFMRSSGDFREDSIVKENLLDFEILTRYTPFFAIDDRKRVVDMWRKRGVTTLACAEGEF